MQPLACPTSRQPFRVTALAGALIAIIATLSGCTESRTLPAAPIVPGITISPRQASIFMYSTAEFLVDVSPGSVTPNWECIVSDSALGTAAVSARGCTFRAGRGSRSGTLTVKVGSHSDEAQILVFGTGR